MSIAVKTLRNIQRTVAANEPFLETAIRWRRNACEFKGTKVHQVGEDKYGNKYFEDKTDENINNLMGRSRWVEYPYGIGTRNATMVPPEWHGWLHYTTDLTGPEMIEKYSADKPFLADHSRTLTGTENAYTPDNYHKNERFDVQQATGTPEDLENPYVEERHYARAKAGGFSVDDL